MTAQIVTVNVSQIQAPIPSLLQKTGALISQGGTTLAASAYSLLTEAADLTALLAAPLALTTVAWASSYGGQVTATAGAVHGIAVNSQFTTTIAGVVPAAYNGTYLCIATSTTAFTYYLPGSDPGAQTTAGTYLPRNAAELVTMASTFFGQGAAQSVYVLELGAGEPAAAITALSAFIDASPQFFYLYMVPRNWDGNSSFLSFLAGFEATTSKTYFFVTTTLQNYGLYTALMKDVVALIQAPIYGTWPSNVITGATYSTGVVTATTTTNHGIAPGQYFTISGFTPAGYNGTFMALPGSTGTALLYAVRSDPGSDTIQGTVVASVYASTGAPATEFTHAADFQFALNYDPSSTNPMSPFTLAPMFGVTPFPIRGTSALLTTLNTANINYVSTGAAGGISDAILAGGHTMDGRQFNYWYSVDWMQINISIGLTNELINGAVPGPNPLFYDQDGINRLQARMSAIGSSAITFRLATGRTNNTALTGPQFTAALNRGDFAGTVECNAVPFPAYTRASPSDFRIGKYAGLSMVYVPARGFEHIIVNVLVSDFPS